jgi:hypothetical protein
LDCGQTEAGQQKGRAKIKNRFENLKRYLGVLGKDFQRRLHRAPFVLEVIGVCIVSAYTYQAWLANRLTREAIEAGQRPILSVKLTDKTLIVGNVPKMNFEIDNLGRIPALNVRLKACGDIAIIPDDKFVLPDCATAPHPASVIFPGYPEQEHAHGHHPMSASEDVAIKNKVSAFYVMGLIRYADAHRADYFTRFCFRYPSLAADSSESEAQSCPNPGANDAN